MRVRVSLLLLGILAIGVVSVAAAGPHHEEGWMSSMARRVGSWMPFGSKLGHDHSDTMEKVEHIYQSTHDSAQRRVEELKENTLKESEIQKAIAEIYHEEAQRAEKEIEALKHPMLEWLIHWRSTMSNAGDAAGDMATGATDSAKDIARKAKAEVDSITKKISASYQSALDTAKHTAAAAAGSAATSGIPSSLAEAKQKAAEAYSHAFHRGHGETRTMMGKLRDSLGRGAYAAKSAATWTMDLVSRSVMAGVFATLGAVGACYGHSLWRRRKYNRQLNAHISGPIVAMGEFWVAGNEAMQNKFYSYWSGPAQAYFQRQPGLRKHLMHRGVPGAAGMWMCYSEWESIEHLRRAVRTAEFEEIKKRAPQATTSNMTLYQLGSAGRHEGDADAPKEQHSDTRGLRQRGTATPTATAVPTSSS